MAEMKWEPNPTRPFGKEDLIVNGVRYTYHHRGAERGYISRKRNNEGFPTYGIIKPYKGRFGVGYVHCYPRWDTTQYCYKYYYIAE